jgi:hypothetical protein
MTILCAWFLDLVNVCVIGFVLRRLASAKTIRYASLTGLLILLEKLFSEWFVKRLECSLAVYANEVNM